MWRRCEETYGVQRFQERRRGVIRVVHDDNNMRSTLVPAPGPPVFFVFAPS